jgi:hypothetical protein
MALLAQAVALLTLTLTLLSLAVALFNLPGELVVFPAALFLKVLAGVQWAIAVCSAEMARAGC